MAWVMSMLGLIAVAAGGGWIALVIGTDVTPQTGIAMYSMLFAAAPGASLFGSGLVFMSIGAGLFRLAQIHDEARHQSNQLDRIADEITRREQGPR